MFLSHLNFVNKHTLFSPEDVLDKTDATQPINKDGILDILNDESEKGEIIPLDDTDKDDKTEKKEKKEPKEDKEKEDVDDNEKELQELEEDLEEVDEDKLELVTPVRRSEILKEYPDLFKKFPYLEKAYYREQQFTEVFPTIQDAKEAADSIKILSAFESDISHGNTEKLLSGLKETNPKGFNKLVDNYLPNLFKTDKDAYTHVIGNLTKNIVSNMIKTARADNNEALEIAGNLLYKWAFNTTTWEAPTNLSNDKDDIDNSKLDEVSKAKEEFNNQKLESASNDLTDRFNNSMKATIDAYIDPKESMSPYVKKHATNECLETLNSLIEKDTRFKQLVDKMWQKAAESNYSRDSLETITRAFKSKAKTLLPAVIKAARKEALKGSNSSTKTNDDNDDNRNNDEKIRPRNTNRETTSPRLKSGNNDGPKPGESTADYFARD